MSGNITRRQWLGGSAAVAAAGWLASGSGRGDEPGTAKTAAVDECRVFFGDLHNHNSVGYAQGTLERTFEIVRNHLDFFAFTPHGYRHDIGHYENQIENKWLRGFDVTRDRRPEVLALVRKYDQPGKFAAIAGYEWHSTSLGDYHIIFPTADAEYVRFDDLKEFQRFARRHGALLIPHHPANRLGHRGADPTHWDPQVSPVLEIYSDWGNWPRATRCSSPAISPRNRRCFTGWCFTTIIEPRSA